MRNEILQNIISKNNGRITVKEAEVVGIHRMYLKKSADEGKLIRVSRGIYQAIESFEDELFNLQTQYPSGVFSFETALFLHSLLERVPMSWTMSFKGGYHSDALQSKGVIVKHSSEKLYTIEIEDVKTPSGNTVKAYSTERTLCEIVTTKAATDIQVITYAFKEYAKSKSKNIPHLMELSKTFHVESKIRSYLEVLL